MKWMHRPVGVRLNDRYMLYDSKGRCTDLRIIRFEVGGWIVRFPEKEGARDDAKLPSDLTLEEKQGLALALWRMK